ncbi:MAG: hypothetical protein OXM55_06440 [Bdellovibrionales bacterium]|nr:hypothetical protein [Bdellovibrionales bacterium]
MIKFVIFCFFVSFLTYAVDGDVDYIDLLLEQDDIEVDCSNILEITSSYVNLSESHQNLLGVSARRFLSALELFDSVHTQQELEALKIEIAGIRQDIEGLTERSFVLPDKSDAILEVLPGCLRKQ